MRFSDNGEDEEVEMVFRQRQVRPEFAEDIRQARHSAFETVWYAPGHRRNDGEARGIGRLRYSNHHTRIATSALG